MRMKKIDVTKLSDKDIDDELVTLRTEMQNIRSSYTGGNTNVKASKTARTMIARLLTEKTSRTNATR